MEMNANASSAKQIVEECIALAHSLAVSTSQPHEGP